MAAKKKCPPEGAPEWVMTYGDMMSLLLTFFIMLVAISEVKKEDQYRVIVDAVKKHFGTLGGGALTPGDGDPENSPLIEHLDVINKGSEPQKSNSKDPGIVGKEQNVKFIREGDRYRVGGPVTFDPGSAVLNQKAVADLDRIAEQIRGKTNKLELRGHAAQADMAVDSPYQSLDDLCYARAVAVKRYLTSPEVGIRSERIRLITAGDNEPLEHRVYTKSAQEPNRRVEVIEIEALVNDYRKNLQHAGY